MKTKIIFPLAFICLSGLQFCFINYLFSQDTIYLKNPSFEDVPHAGGQFTAAIKDWQDCGSINFPGQTPPDIHPAPNHVWEVTKQAHDGKTYLGMVTRYSDTYESISQALSKPVEAGKCYTLSGYLALSGAYKSPTQRSYPSTTLEDFSHPVELLVWGGKDYCKRDQLLVHSGSVSNQDWKLFTLEFSPKETYQYITIGAFFEYGYTKPYNGHILVDGLSPIIETGCKN